MKNTLVIIAAFFLLVWIVPNSGEKTILLSFDVEPVDKEQTIDILNMLEDEDIKATFFVTGEYAKQYPQVTKRIAREHEIACHTYSHPRMDRLNSSEKKNELLQCIRIVKQVSGVRVEGFRAPYTMIDKETFTLVDKYFAYDASCFKRTMIAPSCLRPKMNEVRISSFLLIPLEDVIWTHFLPFDDLFFKILEWKKEDNPSYLFHPHIILENKKSFREALQKLKAKNYKFITHKEYIVQNS